MFQAGQWRPYSRFAVVDNICRFPERRFCYARFLSACWLFLPGPGFFGLLLAHSPSRSVIVGAPNVSAYAVYLGPNSLSTYCIIVCGRIISQCSALEPVMFRACPWQLVAITRTCFSG